LRSQSINFSFNAVQHNRTPSINFNCCFTVHFDKYKIILQQMHYLLKHKMLQFVFKCLYMAPTYFGPSGPSSGSIYWNLTKVTVSLKHQLKEFVVCALGAVLYSTAPNAHTTNWNFHCHCTTIILTMCFNFFFKETVTLGRFQCLLLDDGPEGPKHAGAI
jgi:Na+/alanine symporter